MVAYEVTQFLRNKKKGKTGYAAVKLDMSKAYDRVEWSFLQAMMRKLGFHDKWNRLILKCVSTVSYKIRVNNESTPKQFLQIEDFGKVTRYHHIYLLSVLKLSLHGVACS